MSTTQVETWATDLGQVGPIYPWVGAEVYMFVAAVVLWLCWHVWQIKFESDTYREEAEKHATPENLEKQAAGETYLHH